VSDDIDIAQFHEGKTDIAGRTISHGDVLDINNSYRIIKSADNLSQVVINSAGKTSKIIVG